MNIGEASDVALVLQHIKRHPIHEGGASGPLAFLRVDQPWADEALCQQTDPELFYPETSRPTNHEAKAICAGCFVQAECLTYALETNQTFGIWGGLSVQERHRLTHTNEPERTAS